MPSYQHPVDLMSLPCGGIAYLDEDSGISYRCGHCGAVIGSIGMPQPCKDAMKKWENWQDLGGQGWNYRVPDDYMDDWS